ncbi:MAG: glycosyltransferase family 4 protein [Elusimicrobiota bacterium]|nr:glycosyltransferase family 4 protein [Elusimicrobiota bacterium]
MKRRLAVAARRVQGFSGAARMIVEHARRLSRGDWEVHVFAEKLDRKALLEAGAVPHWVPGWPWGSWMKRRAFAAAAEGMTKKFDLVHGHGDLLDQDVLSLHNCVHAAHESLYKRPLPEDDAVGRMHALQLEGGRFRALVANSRLMKDDVTRRFGVPAEAVSVIYPGYDACRFNTGGRGDFSAPMRAELGVKPGEILYGLVTSGDFEKRGLKPFLRAFAAVARKHPQARALVVGKEARPGPYLALARELGIVDRVIFRDPIPEVWRFYHALDVYVHPAKWEEFGMSVLEALACGLPVITGASVGAAELLKGEQREYVLADPSGQALENRMLALANHSLRDQVGALGPSAALPCAWDRSASALLGLYESLIR